MQSNTSDDFGVNFGQLSFRGQEREQNVAEVGGGRTDDDNDNDHSRLEYASSTTQIYRPGRRNESRGIKVSSRSRLEKEERISKHLHMCLPKSCPQRRIVKLQEEEGQQLHPSSSPSVSMVENKRMVAHFEWVNGITLEEWLNNNQRQNPPLRALHHRHQKEDERERDTKTRLRVALALAKALCDHHEAGVIHNNIFTSNVIVDSHYEGSADHYCSATLIDLAESILMMDYEGGEEGGDATIAALVSKDLEQLGRVFQRLFGTKDEDAFERYNDRRYPLTEEPMDEEIGGEGDGEVRFPDNKRKKRGKSSRATEDMPLYLASIISALTNQQYNSYDPTTTANNMLETHGERYEDAKSVLSDLKTALLKYDVYFQQIDREEASLLNYLPVPRSAFYGRRTELSILMSSLHSVVNLGKPVMTMVRGHAGIGKTALVNQTKKAIEARNGYLILGKFDMVDGSRPDNVLFEALNTFFGTIIAHGTNVDGAIPRMRQRIVDIVGFGTAILAKSIPNLGKLLGDIRLGGNDDPTNTNHDQLLQRSRFLICKLLQAISDIKTPICIVFDDIQWCDCTSLSIIQTIATDPDIQYCLYIGCYRDENQATLEPIKRMESAIKSQGVNVFSINLLPLEKESVNMFISESMCLPPSLSAHLSSVLHRKTAGSPLFLRSLLSDGMIRYNLTTRRYDYDTNEILMKEIPQEIVQYLASRMSLLPQSYRLVLKLASCLGFCFDGATFTKARVKSERHLENVLPSVCQIGYIHEISPGKFIWAHDQVMQAANRLIPANMKEQFQLLIGTRLLMNTPETELESTIFSILVHMNKGIRLIQHPDQKYEIAELNLMAGKICIRTLSFHSAARYFTNGIALLPGDCFENEYQLSLELHDLAQNTLSMTGDFDKMSSLASRELSHAKCFQDKVNTYRNLVGHLISAGKHEEAVSKMSEILDEMGEPLPGGGDHRTITKGQCLREYVALMVTLRFKTERDILSIPKMSDSRHLVLLDFLQTIISTTSNLKNPMIGALVIFRMVRMSLKYGLSEVSAIAFASMGPVLINGPKEDYSGGLFYASLALKTLDHFPTNKYTSRVYCIAYGFVLIWRDPMQASLEKLLEGYDIGCNTGDQEFACWNLLSYAGLALYTGQPLQALEKDLKKYIKRAIQCQRIAAACSITPLLSAVLDLDGSKNDEDIYMHFLNTTEDKMLQSNDRRACVLIWTKRKFSRVMKNDMDGAIAVYKLSTGHRFGKPMYVFKTIPFIMGVFLDGLIAFYAARKKKSTEKKWLDLGLESLNAMKKWAKLSKWNFHSKLLLLEAEYLFVRGDGLALGKYESAITAAQTSRFIHEEGLAYSKLGHYHLSHGRDTDASQSFAHAKRCFKKWGARRLVEGLGNLI